MIINVYSPLVIGDVEGTVVLGFDIVTLLFGDGYTYFRAGITELGRLPVLTVVFKLI